MHLRGLLLDHPQDGRAALLIWDHCYFCQSEGDQIRHAVAEATEIPFDRVLLTATHTHSGYASYLATPSEYIDLVASCSAVAAQKAMRSLEPVRAGWKSVPAPGISRKSDGLPITHRRIAVMLFV